ncbi:MAG: GAF domain-containing protein, partial [Betaproteobacteria bacterium]
MPAKRKRSCAALEREAKALRAALSEAQEQQAAISDVLRVMSGARGNVIPVLQVVAEHALRLCRTGDARIWLMEGDRMTYVAGCGRMPASKPGLAVAVDRRSVPGRAMLNRKPIHVKDFAAEPPEKYPVSRQIQSKHGALLRTMLAVPLLHEKRALGVILLRKSVVQPFTRQQIALVQTFANQAAIAIENVRLFNETNEALEQQIATAEILRVISSSPTDTQPVFDAIVKSGMRLFGGMNVSLRVVRGSYAVRVASTSAIDDPTGHSFPLEDEGLPGVRAMSRRETVEVPDINAEQWASSRVKQTARRRGWRAILAAPMLRDSGPIGLIAVTRATPGRFTDRQIALLKTFADQAVIAIENVRLFKELQTRNADVTEALEQQTATSEILRVISQSPTDAQPAFDTIAESAARLCESLDGTIFRRDGDRLVLAAHHGSIPLGPIGEFSLPLDRGVVPGRSILDGQMVHVADLQAESGEFPVGSEHARRLGWRTALCVPLMREGVAIGVIGVRRVEAQLFSDRQVALLETFADQAVIAIENARLFKELQTRNADVTEALEQQTATSEILRVISQSPTDVQPVFEAIVSSAARLCDAEFSAVTRFDGSLLHLAAISNMSPAETKAYHSLFPRPPLRNFVIGRAFVECRPVHVEDVLTDPDYDRQTLKVLQRAATYRTYLGIPIIRNGVPIGVIGCGRHEMKPFTQAQIDLVKTFADQAVIAIENVRLFNETKEALEQQTVISEILRVISSSPTDTQPVFDAIVKSGVHLFGGMNVSMRLINGDHTETVASTLSLSDYDGPIAYPLGDERNISSRAIVRGEVVQVADVFAEAWVDERVRDRARRRGHRAIMAAPMLRENHAVGVMVVTRAAPGPFSEKQIALLKTFSDQAVIAIENVRLFKELQARNAEITEALEQQTATAEILKVISSSPTDTQPVFDAIVKSGFRLFGGANVTLLLARGADIVRVASTVPAFAANPEPFPNRIDDDNHPPSRAMLRREVVHVPDISAEDWISPRIKQRVRQLGVRAELFVPLLREDGAVGVIIVNRPTPGPFSDKQIALLKTFADQAVIAIENVRLFKELQARNDEITEALEQQTATAEILKVISRSPTDTQPVFDTIAESAVRLCGGVQAWVNRFDGEMSHIVSHANVAPEVADFWRKEFASFPLHRKWVTTRAILSGRVEHVPDVEQDAEYDHATARTGNYRSALAVPLVQEGRMIGAIGVGRTDPGPFPESQIKLLQTFADQAVIAVQNVRLFNETKEALDQQTATAGILGVISSSPTDTQPVFDAIVESGVRLFGGVDMSLRLVKGDHTEIVATTELASGVHLPTPLNDDRRPSARAILRREIVHIPDIFAEEWLSEGTKARAKRRGNRALLYAPMVQKQNVIGAIGVTRGIPGSFTEKEITLLKTFADQAVIAIENVRLFKELQARNAELAEALEQQTATSEILNVISQSTLDVSPVFQSIAQKAVELCGADNASVLQREGDAYRYVANAGNFADQDAFMSFWGTIPLQPGRGSLTGRVALERRSVQIEDVDTDPEYEREYAAHKVSGSKAHLGVPLLKEGEPIGLIIARRFTPQLFTEKQVRILETFAAQAVIAVENVRLFKELQARNSALTESLEQQTATGEILRVISQSPTDVQPVFDTIAESAARLCESLDGGIFRRDGDRLVLAAHHGPIPLGPIREFTLPLDRGNVPGRAIMDGQMVHVADLQAEPDEFPEGSEVARRSGFRTVLSVPLMREGVAIGVIGVLRAEARPFSDRQIALLKTFA